MQGSSRDATQTSCINVPPSPPQVLSTARNVKAVEDILRTVTTEMGSKSGVSGAPLNRKTCVDYGVPHSVSQAWRIGRAIALCRKRNNLKGIPKAIVELQNGACLFIGKIVDVRLVRTPHNTFAQVPRFRKRAC